MHRSPFVENIEPLPLKLPLRPHPLMSQHKMSQHTLHLRLQLMLQLLLQLPDQDQVSTDGLSMDWRKSTIEIF